MHAQEQSSGWTNLFSWFTSAANNADENGGEEGDAEDVLEYQVKSGKS